MPSDSDNRKVVSRIRRHNRWLAESGRVLHQPDLKSYRNLLLETLAPASARVHLSSIRRSYKTLVENPQHRVDLVQHLQREYATADSATIKAMADELKLRLMRAIDPQLSRVTIVSVQDEADSKHIRLTPAQGAALMMRPDLSQLRGRRDVALIALLLATGLREGEVVQLEIDDLYQTYGGVRALRVKSGKGAKARMVPFGDMLWACRTARPERQSVSTNQPRFSPECERRCFRSARRQRTVPRIHGSAFIDYPLRPATLSLNVVLGHDRWKSTP